MKNMIRVYPNLNPYGHIIILDFQSIMAKIADVINQAIAQTARYLPIALPGGSTAKSFYQWAIENKALKQNSIRNALWMTSDERYVPLESPESNFGNADRLMLTPLSVPQENKRPWDVSKSPEEAALIYNNYFTDDDCFDVCLLGMGEDCHIASIFPESPLILNSPKENFTSINVPGKGVRLTITPSGLNRCRRIYMIVTGRAKSASLRDVFFGPFNPEQKPAQIHKKWSHKMTWLIDDDAAYELYRCRFQMQK